MLAVGAVHHHLIRKGLRAKCGIVVETGDARETHHFATLVGYGANAVNPYLVTETIVDLQRRKSWMPACRLSSTSTTTARVSTAAC